jgi:hypothetical protein
MGKINLKFSSLKKINILSLSSYIFLYNSMKTVNENMLTNFAWFKYLIFVILYLNSSYDYNMQYVTKKEYTSLKLISLIPCKNKL